MEFHQVLIAEQRNEKRHPTIGDDVVIGSGAQIIGPVKVGNGQE